MIAKQLPSKENPEPKLSKEEFEAKLDANEENILRRFKDNESSDADKERMRSFTEMRRQEVVAANSKLAKLRGDDGKTPTKSRKSQPEGKKAPAKKRPSIISFLYNRKKEEFAALKNRLKGSSSSDNTPPAPPSPGRPGSRGSQGGG